MNDYAVLVAPADPDGDPWEVHLHRLAWRAKRHTVALYGPDLARLLAERDCYAAAANRLEHETASLRGELLDRERTIAEQMEAA